MTVSRMVDECKVGVEREEVQEVKMLKYLTMAGDLMMGLRRELDQQQELWE